MSTVIETAAQGASPLEEIEPNIAFWRGRFMPLAEANVNLATHALQYGTGCFEGIRAYWNARQEQLYVLKMVEHYQRFLSSCRLLRIECPYGVEELAELTIRLLRENRARADMYIRPIAIKASRVIKVTLSGLRDEVGIFCVSMGDYVSTGGLHVQISAWQRISDNAVPSRSKTTGSYVNTALAYDQAYRDGYDDCLLLNGSGHVAEASGANFFIVRDGVLITPPVTEDILEGITRRCVMELAREMGRETIERPIDRTEVYTADEAFLCGTGVQVAPITRVDGRPLGGGTVGPFAKALQERYFRACRGEDPNHRDWLTPVY